VIVSSRFSLLAMDNRSCPLFSLLRHLVLYKIEKNTPLDGLPFGLESLVINNVDGITDLCFMYVLKNLQKCRIESCQSYEEYGNRLRHRDPFLCYYRRTVNFSNTSELELIHLGFPEDLSPLSHVERLF
jgi:hypothetical protein